MPQGGPGTQHAAPLLSQAVLLAGAEARRDSTAPGSRTVGEQCHVGNGEPVDIVHEDVSEYCHRSVTPRDGFLIVVFSSISRPPATRSASPRMIADPASTGPGAHRPGRPGGEGVRQQRRTITHRSAASCDRPGLRRGPPPAATARPCPAARRRPVRRDLRAAPVDLGQ